MSASDRRALIDRGAPSLSVRRQCVLLGVARSGVYRARRPANDNDLLLKRRIDELYTAWPFLGSRRMTALLRIEGQKVNRKRVQRLMRRMGIAALGPRPRTTKLVLCQPCSDMFRADLLPHSLAVGGGGGEAVPGDADGGRP